MEYLLKNQSFFSLVALDFLRHNILERSHLHTRRRENLKSHLIRDL
jgi:hypothetical protein